MAGRRRGGAQPAAGDRPGGRAGNHLAHGAATGPGLSAEDRPGHGRPADRRAGQATRLGGRGERGGAGWPPAASPRCSRPCPGVGTISGGVLQGLVQVLVTRWIGGVFIEYFRNEMSETATDWASLARAQWAKVTQPEELARLVKTGIDAAGRPKVMTEHDGDSAADVRREADRHHRAYTEAMASVRHAIAQFDGCSEAEKASLAKELAELESISRKLEMGHVEIVHVRRDRHRQERPDQRPGRRGRGRGRRSRRLDQGSLEHVAGTAAATSCRASSIRKSCCSTRPASTRWTAQQRATMAHDAAARADLILFVTDSDLNHTEYTALAQPGGDATSRSCWCSTRSTTTRPSSGGNLREALATAGCGASSAPDDIVETAADPLPREYVIEAADGSTPQRDSPAAAAGRGAQGADSGSAGARRQGPGGPQRRDVRRRPQRSDRRAEGADARRAGHGHHLELCGDEVDRRGAESDAGGRRAGRQRRRRDDGRHAGPRLRHFAHLGQRPATDRVDPEGGRLGHAGRDGHAPGGRRCSRG